MKHKGSERDWQEFSVRSCQGKRAFLTYREADRARKITTVHLGARLPMQTYRCEVCRQFHFGRIPDHQMRERKKLRQQRLEQGYDGGGVSA